jgi:small subunit ribosomal protein S1
MDAGDLDDLPELGLSDDVFAEGATPPEAGVEEPPEEAEAEAEVNADVEADSQGEADVPAEDEEPSA